MGALSFSEWPVTQTQEFSRRSHIEERCRHVPAERLRFRPDGGVRQPVNQASVVQQTAASTAATEACGIWVLT